MGLNFRYLLFVIVISALLLLTISCHNNPIQLEDNVTETEIVISVFPDIGTKFTKFQPHIFVVSNSDTVNVGEALNIRCDYDDDGIPDTDWLDTIPQTSAYAKYGKHRLNIELLTSNGTIDSAFCNIYVQNLIQITQTNTSGHSEGNIDWSRDGTNRITYDRAGEDPGSIRSIWIINYPHGEPEQVTFNPDISQPYAHTFPEWSPDGDRIAYENNNMEVINLSSGQVDILDEIGGSYIRSWSPNGRWILYWGYHKGVAKTLAYDFVNDTSEVFINDHYCIGWSPNGIKLAICRKGEFENSTLQIIDFESRLVIEEYIIPSHGYKIEWSPDGKWISLGFHELKKHAYLFNYETKQIFTWEPDNLSSCWFPSWSEDGSLLAFEGKDTIEGVWSSIWAIELPEDM